jgi:hypothetical protein
VQEVSGIIIFRILIFRIIILRILVFRIIIIKLYLWWFCSKQFLWPLYIQL